MSLITIKNLTKDYQNNRGVFDVCLNIEQGETFGIVGINGAGKTTLLRHLMGFIQSDTGTCTINNLDCWKDSDKIKKMTSYIPGEISFPPLRTGEDFIKVQSEFWNVTNLEDTKEITKRLQLDLSANLKRMSKGMKQKTAIAASFLPDNEILIFDEPTTGLDPLMRNVFLDIIRREKEKGKTIIMSSHMFEEIEDCCDKVAIIKDGCIIALIDMDDVRHNKEKSYKIEFLDKENYSRFQKEKIDIFELKSIYNQVFIHINDTSINDLMTLLSNYKIKFISENKYTLEEHFLKIYQNGGNKK